MKVKEASLQISLPRIARSASLLVKNLSARVNDEHAGAAGFK
jgi:hypothetical protein